MTAPIEIVEPTEEERRNLFPVTPPANLDLRDVAQRFDDRHRVVMEYLARIETKIQQLMFDVEELRRRPFSPED